MKRKHALLLTLLAFLPLCYTVAFFATARCGYCDSIMGSPDPRGLAIWYASSIELNADLSVVFGPLFAIVKSTSGPDVFAVEYPEAMEASYGSLPPGVALRMLRHPAVAIVVLANVLALLYWIVQACCLWRDRRRRAAGLCIRCGYPLRGNVSGRCPECGTGVARVPNPGGVARNHMGRGVDDSPR